MSVAIVVLSLTAAFIALRRRRARGDALRMDPQRVLGSVAAGLARGVVGGMTPAESFAVGSARFGGGVGEELRKVNDALERGVPLDRALTEWVERERRRSRNGRSRRRHPSPEDVELLACAIRFAEPRGAGLVAAFEGVAVALMDRAELADEIRALTSQAWASVIVLCSLPVAGIAMVAIVAPGVLSTLFATPFGLGCLTVAVVADAAAVLLGRRMTRWAIG